MIVLCCIIFICLAVHSVYTTKKKSIYDAYYMRFYLFSSLNWRIMRLRERENERESKYIYISTTTIIYL